MRLADFLREEQILTDLKGRKKEDLLDEMVTEVSSMVDGVDKQAVLKALLDREKLGTTGIGHGVAIPHGKIKGLSDIKVFFGRSIRGVDFQSMDNIPVHLFFMIITPENSAAAHLKILASISHLLKNLDCREKLLKASTGSEIYRIIAEAEKRT
ncbi:MAG: PTS sugar transporter subunit IIA [Deltaproteobacteria bacterium]|nr:PTS sugar transporter subunit IIA [Deltaproteobacteria bacterium]